MEGWLLGREVGLDVGQSESEGLKDGSPVGLALLVGDIEGRDDGFVDRLGF